MVFHYITALSLEIDTAQKARERKLINDRQEQAINAERELRTRDYHTQVWGQWQRVFVVFILGASLVGGPVGYWFGQRSNGGTQGVAEYQIKSQYIHSKRATHLN